MTFSAVAPDVHTLLLGFMPWLVDVQPFSRVDTPPATAPSTPLPRSPERPLSPAPSESSAEEEDVTPSKDASFAHSHPIPAMFDVGPDFLVIPDVNQNSAIVRFEPDSLEDFSSWYYRVKFYDGSSWSPPIYLSFDDAYYDDPPDLFNTTPSLSLHPQKYFAFRNGAVTLALPDHCLWAVLPFPGTTFAPSSY